MSLNEKTRPRRRKHIAGYSASSSPHSRDSSRNSSSRDSRAGSSDSRSKLPRAKRISQAVSNLDLNALKQLARTGDGLQSIRLRRRAWPLLLNFRSLFDARDRDVAHSDEKQVELDIVRTNLPKSTEYRKDEAATKKRQEQLGVVVRTVLRSYPWLGYYQGFHELSLVFLCVFGSERPATEASKMVALFFVRDAMSSNLDNVLLQLQLLYALLKAVSPEIYAMLTELDVPPFFAISWVLTWFAHDLDDFQDICRIFDFLIVSPPLQIVYMAAALIKHNEKEILGCERDFAIVHTTLAKLPQTVNKWKHIINDSFYLEYDYPATKLQHMANCHLPKLSAINSYEATWKRLDPAQPREFISLVPILNNCHPLVSAPTSNAAGKKGTSGRIVENRMARVIDLTSTAQKARDLALQHRWPILFATVASATMVMYAWLLVQQFQLHP
ncbi:GTPase-activating protein gyp8 [Coemansia spiralis]|uniref:GTPase-activating protein gyp8 n=2 Tax=Coemansia TaxID=4863 RepID=A0A9W8FXU1_9FUNG|nr:rab-GTPase-TBC domain-containing protein [Coemansia spiralis]KAJ1987439.1 GTPase-activating protein gyp8 [Coemansia umbellata]KAJ2619313.1 GTPase-activating protein gyp8 [Coemansia sp. RSA 1358]KAJ2670219.1 GTPase-activating protein gyp8 [Coemansia spiralis]